MAWLLKVTAEIECGNADSILQTLQQPLHNLPITVAKTAVRKKIITLPLTKDVDMDSSLVFIDPIKFHEAP